MHKFLSSILSGSHTGKKQKGSCASVTDYLQLHDSISGILPNANRLIRLQHDCQQIFPDYFGSCEVLQLQDETLTVAVPNQAYAARLRQKLPLLKKTLEETGWQVKSIRLKVKLKQKTPQTVASFKPPLPQSAVEELSKLRGHLSQSGTDPALAEALANMVNRYRTDKE